LLADLALINGKILTMNLVQPFAESVAVKGNKIIKVGATEEIIRLIGEDTMVIRLNGKTVLPGFIDTHIHVTDFGRLLAWLDLTNVKSISELREAVKNRVEKTGKGRWILGRGWNENRFKEKGLPTRQEVDEVSPDNPVVLYHEVEQACLVNSKGFELAGITAETFAPEGGSIVKNAETGEPTGILRDSATNLVWQKIPEPDENELLEATAFACQKIGEAGVTGVHWMVLSPVELPIIQKLHAQKRLPIRVNLIISANLLDALKDFKSDDDSALRVGGAVIAADGYLASKTAALTQPYSDDTNSSGQMLLTPQEIEATAKKILGSGLQLVIHAMGDKAVDAALTTTGKLTAVASTKNTSVRFEQAALLNPNLIERIKNQRAIVSVQPLVVASEFSVWHAKEHLGTERARWLFPVKTLLNKGVRVVCGSDCPMELLSPLAAIQAVVTREPAQRVSIEEALRMYTVEAAFASGEEKLKGSIVEGKLADLIVLSRDPTAIPANEIKDANVDLVIINGKIA
jgi:predicted amidohydrolase YtcJ